MNATDKKNPVFLSIVIPSFNSSLALSKNLGILVSYLQSKSFSWELILVDDGSTDNGETEKIATNYSCIFLKNESNLGKGSAIRKGMLNATGRFRLFTDADIPYEPEVIDQFLHYLDFKEFHMAVGDRTLEGASYFAKVGMIRNWASRLFSFIVGRFVAGGMFDTQCGIKGFRAEVAEDIFSVSRINSFAFDVEVLYISLKRNYDVKRLPVRLRSQDGNTVNVAKASLLMLADISRIIYNYYSGNYQKK